MILEVDKTMLFDLAAALRQRICMIETGDPVMRAQDVASQSELRGWWQPKVTVRALTRVDRDTINKFEDWIRDIEYELAK